MVSSIAISVQVTLSYCLLTLEIKLGWVLVFHMNLKNIVGTIIFVLGFDMKSQLVRLGLSNCPSSPVKTKVEYCNSLDHFSYQVMDCSTTRIQSLSIAGCHQRPTGNLVVGGSYSSTEVQLMYSTALLNRAV